MKIGLNTYGCRKVFQNDLHGSLERIKKIGISVIEVCVLTDTSEAQMLPHMNEEMKKFYESSDYAIGFLPFRKAGNVIDLMRGQGFIVDTAHLGLPHKKTDENIRLFVRESIKFAKEQDISYYVISPMLRLKEMEGFAGEIEYMASEFKKEGISALMHNHHMECEPEDNATAIEYMMEKCPSINLEPDVGWMMAGGMDVVRFLQKYGGRVMHLHLKDFKKGMSYFDESSGRFSAIGEGELPLEEILEAAEKNCSITENGMIIDQDDSAGDYLADISRGYENVMRSLRCRGIRRHTDQKRNRASGIRQKRK